MKDSLHTWSLVVKTKTPQAARNLEGLLEHVLDSFSLSPAIKHREKRITYSIAHEDGKETLLPLKGYLRQQRGSAVPVYLGIAHFSIRHEYNCRKRDADAVPRNESATGKIYKQKSGWTHDGESAYQPCKHRNRQD